jgi:hypothetical protein
MNIPSEIYIVRYVQAYVERFNKDGGFPGGVVESYEPEEKGLFVQIFLPTTCKRISKTVPWADVLRDGKKMGVTE